MTAERRSDLGYAAGVAIGIVFLIASGALALHDEQVRTRDFAGIWTGSRAIVDGHDPYDAATWPAVAATYGNQTPDTDVYGYPRWVALAFVPLALLPVATAATIWLWGGIGIAVIAMRALLRAAIPGNATAHAVIGGTLFIAQPGYQAVVNGQWTFVLLATTSAVLVLARSGRPVLSAIAALGWLAKPQLFIGYALGVARRDRTFAYWAAALAVAAVVASTVTAPGWVMAWWARVAPVRIVAPATLYSAATDLFGRAGLALAAVIVAAGVIVCLRQAARSDASLALWSGLSLVAAPYAWSYDLLLLLPPVVLAAGVVARRDVRRATWVVLVFAVVFVLATPLLFGVALARGRETFTAVVPLATFVALSLLLWRVRAGGGSGAPATRAA